ncbi:MAG TPA: hypothetical protein VM884_10745 [Flavisolibacter sp.]|jgi:peroxiredoxin|nr:hypothetical protein [Flavisolibacter sp.]
MKKTPFLLTAFLLFATIGTLQAQAQNQSKLPLFSMLLTNGKVLTTTNLSPAKPTILIYFAPDCEHCQVLMNAFFKRPAAFKNAQVLMVTFKPLNELGRFEESFKTYKYSNIYVGAETKPLYLQTFYKLQNTPFTALYDKSKNLVASFGKETSVDNLLKKLESLK